MSIELLQDMFYAAPELWYGLGAVLLAAIVFARTMYLKAKQQIYFLRRDRERYAETLYASHDGYFAFIYPDYRVNDPRQEIVERCSRRLAVMLGLSGGVKASFAEVLKNFYKDDGKKIEKYVGLLRKEGTAFEDYFELKTSQKIMRLEGVRINGSDGSIYCDMIWFRDVSNATRRIKLLEQQKDEAERKYWLQRDLTDNLPFAVWLRDEKSDIIYCNKRYHTFAGCTKEESGDEVVEICDTQGGSLSKALANEVRLSQKGTKISGGIIHQGNRIAVEAYEIPFCVEQNLDKTYSVGCMIDVSELDELKRTQRQHQEAQLMILGKLGTAFAVFGGDMNLDFYNQAFADAWSLKKSWLQQKNNYSAFLDEIRENRLLPEVPDYRSFKKGELKVFSQLIEPISDLLHLPNGKTYRRTRAPYLLGGVIFAYEDISDRLAATSAYNALYNVQQEILNNLPDGVLVFGENGRLNFFNEAYAKMWQVKKEFLMGQPDLGEVLDSQRHFFENTENWEHLKKEISDNILNLTTKTLALRLNGGQAVQINVARLSDGNLMLIYR
ncbi:MAG: PAS-domain containing protein [Alphaproteobacteria bacterium]|nr:PAS-domain containing protein [Alphaproteobacteria bacterium]